MNDRELVLEIVTRMRESEEEARKCKLPANKAYWEGRARAFDEVYTELKGRGYDGRSTL